MTPRFSLDKNPVDSLWKAALPAALSNIQSLMASDAFAKSIMFRSYEHPAFRAHWNLSYTRDFVSLFDILQHLRKPATSYDGDLVISGLYSTYQTVSMGFVLVESYGYTDSYEYAAVIDLITWSIDQVRTAYNDLDNDVQRDAFWQVLDLIDHLPTAPGIERTFTFTESLRASLL